MPRVLTTLTVYGDRPDTYRLVKDYGKQRDDERIEQSTRLIFLLHCDKHTFCCLVFLNLLQVRQWGNLFIDERTVRENHKKAIIVFFSYHAIDGAPFESPGIFGRIGVTIGAAQVAGIPRAEHEEAGRAHSVLRFKLLDRSIIAAFHKERLNQNLKDFTQV